MVTGGGTGIGRAIALALAAARAKVAVVSRTQGPLSETVHEIRARGGRDAVAVTADVTRREEISRAVEVIRTELGPVDVLVNNAGISRAIGPAWQLDPDMWWRDVEVCVRGTFLCCHAVLPDMVSRSHGRIINVASAAAFMTLPMASSYGCAKAAVVRFTDALAASVRHHGISVFAISPGPTRTAMTAHILESAEGRKWMPEFQRIPESQWTPAEKIGSFVVALAKGDGDALSGRFLHLRHDLAELVRRRDEIRRQDLYTLRLRE